MRNNSISEYKFNINFSNQKAKPTNSLSVKDICPVKLVFAFAD